VPHNIIIFVVSRYFQSNKGEIACNPIITIVAMTTLLTAVALLTIVLQYSQGQGKLIEYVDYEFIEGSFTLDAVRRPAFAILGHMITSLSLH